jgi:PadR family transcriptional regulator PadR
VERVTNMLSMSEHAELVSISVQSCTAQVGWAEDPSPQLLAAVLSEQSRRDLAIHSGSLWIPVQARRPCLVVQGSATLWCMGEADTRRSQMLRGVLDICLLAVMSEGPAYGYEMTKRLRARGLSTVGEGSIYPLLGRLERDGLVETTRAASNGGPPRKYYSLSPTGEVALESGRREWQMARDAVDGALDLVAAEVGI